MLIVSKKNALFRSSKEHFLLKRGEFRTDIPAWVRESWYFKALVDSGDITVTDSSADKVVEKALEESEVKAKKAKKRKSKEDGRWTSFMGF